MLVLAASHPALRQRRIEQLAHQLGLSFQPTSRDVLVKFRNLYCMDLREHERATNVITGVYRNHTIYAFDYALCLDTHRRRATVFAVEIGASLPPLRVYPKNGLWNLGEALGSTNIELDSIEFSKSFVVQSTETKFAYDICNPRLMSLLLSQGRILLEFGDSMLVVSPCRRTSPEQSVAMLDLLISIREGIPAFVFGE